MRRKHLLAARVRYFLTECGMTSVRLDEVTHELDMMNCPECRAAIIARWACPACGSDGLEWGHTERKFHLGCPQCGETLVSSVSMEDIATALTQRREVLG